MHPWAYTLVSQQIDERHANCWTAPFANLVQDLNPVLFAYKNKSRAQDQDPRELVAGGTIAKHHQHVINMVEILFFASLITSFLTSPPTLDSFLASTSTLSIPSLLPRNTPGTGLSQCLPAQSPTFGTHSKTLVLAAVWPLLKAAPQLQAVPSVEHQIGLAASGIKCQDMSPSP